MKFRHRRTFLSILTLLFLFLTLAELIIYLTQNSNTFGLIYLCIQVFIIFLFIPVFYNYKKYYSKERISKIIILIIIGLFSSFILSKIYFNVVDYIDSSLEFINAIMFIKNYIKPSIYFGLIIFLLYEMKLIKKKSN